MKIAVLGAGMVGRAMACDLAPDFEVHSFDYSMENLSMLKKQNPAIEITQADLTDLDNYKNWFHGFDILVTAVPGFMGFNTLKEVIKIGKPVADISFFPENALELDALAKEMKVTAITDIGVAPGMSNLILGRWNQEMKISSFSCYVGGLPAIRSEPFQYKAPFSPIDVIEEYTRPARLMENGAIVTRHALSGLEHLEFDGIGTLEAFNTDGLRSLLFTMAHIPEMKEKTMRYPGHAERICILRDAGFFDPEPRNFNGINISPLEFTSQILFQNWKLEPDEEELTIMRVEMEGKKNSTPLRVRYELLDRYDSLSRTSSMARSTGYTCTAAVHLIAKNIFNKKGVFPPELIGDNTDCFAFVMEHLRRRGVIWKETQFRD